MGMQDRDWYKEDFARRMGKGTSKKEAGQKRPEENKQESTKSKQPENKRGSFERVKKHEATDRERRTYNNAPPAHTILAAKYELAIRRRAKKTFWSGFAIGAIAACSATALIIPLL